MKSNVIHINGINISKKMKCFFKIFRDAWLTKCLSQSTDGWGMAGLNKQKKLRQAFEKKGQIDNPYKPGQVIDLGDSLFVGRRDLVKQLEEALVRGTHSLTFFLNGERDMGKSSILRQLPNLLSTCYLPIIYDLENQGISSSTSTLLGVIAEEIYKGMSLRGIAVRRLEYTSLREASKENDAAIYYVFDEWLKGVEHTLAHEARTLLLIFDEFDKLEEAGQEGHLNFKLLLDWFRTIIQNHYRVVLLFSGVHPFSEMSIRTGVNWAGYFVNVQTLRVGCLRVDEIYQLITQPIPTFPGEHIFGEEAVEEIINVTGCHPFLVQAVCSALINDLKAEKRNRAETQDVAIAVNKVLEIWWDTYFQDLWERTDQGQRICLFIVIILILNIQGSTILAVLGVIFAMFQWLFPVPSRKHDPSSPTSSASPMPQVVVHVPSDLSLQSSSTNTLIQRDKINLSSNNDSKTLRQDQKSVPSTELTKVEVLHLRPDSVFLFNEPLTESKEFYGRIRERKTLITRTSKGVSTSIVGPRRIGKTWLISYLRLVAPIELGHHFRIGYLDATMASSATMTGFIARVLEEFSIHTLVHDYANLELTMLEKVVRDLKLKNQVPVLCIDEFEGFGNRSAFDLSFFNGLRAMTQVGLGLVVVSKRPLIDIVGDYGKTSGFFSVYCELRFRLLPLAFISSEW